MISRLFLCVLSASHTPTFSFECLRRRSTDDAALPPPCTVLPLQLMQQQVPPPPTPPPPDAVRSHCFSTKQLSVLQTFPLRSFLQVMAVAGLDASRLQRLSPTRSLRSWATPPASPISCDCSPSYTPLIQVTEAHIGALNGHR